MLLKYEKMDKFGHVIVIVVLNEVDESESRNSAVDKVGICKCHSFVLIVYSLCNDVSRCLVRSVNYNWRLLRDGFCIFVW